MGSTTTQTTIANRALQILGYQPISNIQENSRGARAILRAYNPVKESILRENFWSFSLQRASLAASSVPPIFGKSNYFPLPGDFLMLAPPDQNPNVTFGVLPVPPVQPNSGLQYRDYQIEKMGPGLPLAIATNQPAPLQIRYVSNDVTESDFDASFSEAFAARLAIETCEELTQSQTKVQYATTMYKAAIDAAKQRNAFEIQPVQPPVDSWILSRM